MSEAESMTDSTGTYQSTFDSLSAGYKYSPHPMGRLTGTSTQYALLTSRTLTTSYDALISGSGVQWTPPRVRRLDRRTSLTRPNTVSTSYGYDSHGNPGMR